MGVTGHNSNYIFPHREIFAILVTGGLYAQAYTPPPQKKKNNNNNNNNNNNCMIDL